MIRQLLQELPDLGLLCVQKRKKESLSGKGLNLLVLALYILYTLILPLQFSLKIQVQFRLDLFMDV